MTVLEPATGWTLTAMGGCAAWAVAGATAAATRASTIRERILRISGLCGEPSTGARYLRECSRGLPARSTRSDLAPAGAVPAVDLQQRAEPGVRQLVHPVPGLLPAAVDDADLRGLLGLGQRPPRDRLRMVLRGAGVPDRPELVRRGAARAGRAFGGLSESR